MSELDHIKIWEFPSSWCYAKLEDLGCGENAIVDGPFGSNLKVSDYVDDSINGVPVLTTKNLEGDYSKGSVRYISQNKYEGLKRSKVQPGDILVAKIGSIGKTGIYPAGMKTAIIPANLLKYTVTGSVEFKYVFSYLNCLGFQQFIRLIATATAQPAFNVTKFRKLPIPLPPINEQQRIVAKIEELFSELDKGIENLKTAQAQLKVYRQALLKHAFEGKLTVQWRAEHQDKLETAAALLKRIQQERAQRYQQQLADWQTNGGSKPKAPKPLPPLTAEELAELPELPEGWGWVRLGDILSVSSGSGLTSSQMNGGAFPVYGGNGISGYHDEYLFENETLILGRVGAKCGVVHITRPKSWITDNALIVEFLIHSLDQRYLKLRLEYLDLNKHSVSTAQPVISGSKIYPLFIGLPCLQEQIEIANQIESRLSEADQLDQTLTTSLQQAEALRQSILKRAFSGQLVAQDPHDEPASALLARIRTEREQSNNPKRGRKAA